MILRSVELENFGKFRGRTIEFRRGMNLVIGPNEAGKSTLAEAVPAVLFGTDRLERFKSWGRSACAATLYFEGQGRTIQVKRNLITDDVELVEKDDLYHVLSQFSGRVPLRGRNSICREYRELLESLLGVSEERLFRATYFFGHHPQEWSGDELAQKLRTLVSGTAEADYATILDDLLDEHFQLTRNNPWGRDKQRDREYEEVCRLLKEEAEREEVGDEGKVPLFVEIDDSPDFQEELAALAAEVDADRVEYAKGLRYVEHLRSLAVETPATPVVQQRPASSVNTPSVKPSAGQFSALGLPENPPRDLPELLSEAAGIRQEMAALQQPFAALNSREKKIPATPWLALLISGLLLVSAAAVAWWQAYHFLWFVTGALAGITALGGWGSWRQVSRTRALAECRTERGRLEQQRELAQQRQVKLSERCEALGLPASAIDLVRLQKLVTAHRELLEKWWHQENSAVADETECTSPADKTAADITPVELTGAAESAGLELTELEGRLAEFADTLHRKESQLRALREKSATDLSTPVVRTQVTPLHERKDRLEEKITLLRTSINLLAGAVDEFSRSHLTRLNEEASKIFGKITAGRYTSLQLDENMTPMVQIDHKRWLPVENFSRGTVDAIYLALRIALARVRDDGRSLPLMLDDPFVHLDQKRLSAALNLVDLASADGQLILFSHNMDLGKRAARERWHVISLDGDEAGHTAAEGDSHAGQLHLL